VQHIPKPLLKVNQFKVRKGEAGNKGKTWTYSYVDAIKFYRETLKLEISDVQFVEAYKAAGNQYKEEIGSYFVVLKHKP